MKSLNEASLNEFQGIEGVCFDIDDTFSTQGQIKDNAFSALWRLKRAGFKLIPVTGRPAGWCDHIARFWPVDAVVGENGAFVFYMRDGRRERFDLLGTDAHLKFRPKLLELHKKILDEFPHALVASDQDYREYDLAIDFCEDVLPWSMSEVERLVNFCHKAGAHAKISSIHVNAWFGEFDKQKAITAWFKKEKIDLNRWIYVGDSPNDEPAFKLFNKSVGVANLKDFEKKIKHLPTYITEGRSGDGFSQLADKLIEARG